MPRLTISVICLLRLLVVTAKAHVEGEIAGALALGFAEPKLEGGQRPIGPRRANHLDEGCRAADERSLAGRLVRVLGEGAHERQVDVNVGVNETGEDVFAFGVNDLGARRGRRLRSMRVMVSSSHQMSAV